MSALLAEEDIRWRGRNISFVPKAAVAAMP
jgi:hypothetical protein